MKTSATRRNFLKTAGGLAAAAAIAPAARAGEPRIQGFEEKPTDPNASKGWKPVSDRKLRVGIVGYGACQFGAAFGFQDHPNVDVVAVSDLIPDRCAGLAKACRCAKTYPSLEELVKDDRIEAVFVATDAPSHAKHCIDVLKHGKHVASAVPAVFGGSLEEADALYDAVKKSGLKYMMFETSCYHDGLHALRQAYRAGGLGEVIYAEGEYYHYFGKPFPSYKDWRVGAPPQWYPTHSNAYYVGVTGGHFTEVSCMGMPSLIDHLKPENNRYKNPFGSEIALMRTSGGGMARMAVCWDLAGAGGDTGRVFGQKNDRKNVNTSKPPLPPGVRAGGHGGSHGHLMNEFVTAVLENRQPLVNIAWALNMTVAGIVAHQSALKNGELLKIPTYAWS
jgi:hypothetical protein